MRRFDFWRSRRRREEDLNDEIASHLALAVRDRVAAGEDPQTARLAAQKEFGNVILTREATRLAWGMTWLDRALDVLRDVRHALRQLARSPGYSLVVIAVLALGVGTNLLVFGLFKALALTPLGGVPDSGDLHFIGARSTSGEILPISYPDFRDIRDRDRVHAGLAATSVQPLGLGIGERRERVWTELVSGSYFDVLGVAPQVGRALEPADERTPGQGAAVLSDGLWRRAFAADPAVVGTVIHLNSHPVTIVGVAAPEFRGAIVGLATELFVPITMSTPLSAYCNLDDRRDRWLQLFGRLRPDVGLAAARSEAERLSAQLTEEHPIDTITARATIVPLWRWPYGVQTFLLPAVSLLGAMTALLLVVVCANVAGLVLVRGLSRRREIATRLMLGASRGRVLRLLTFESLALALPGAILGLAFPPLAGPFLESAGTSVPLPLYLNITLDGMVVAAALAFAGACAVLYGVAPARTALRVDLAAAAREDVAPAAGSSRLRVALVVSQVAMALMLLVSTGLVVRSLDQARRADPGFDPANVATAVLDLRLNAYDERTGPVFYDRLLEALRADPAVEAASLAAYLPLTGVVWQSWNVAPEGYAPRPDEDLALMVNMVSPDHFRTLRIDLAAGRDFEVTDDDPAPRVIIVNETLARRFWGSPAEAIGRRLQTGETRWTIVGVARDAKYVRLDEDPRPYLYVPFAQSYRPTMTLQVRTTSPGPIERVRRHVRALDSGLPLLEERMLEEQMRFAASIYEMVARTLAIVGIIAIGLAALGIYGLVSYTVKQSAHDIGIRMAIGAPRGTILRPFLLQGLRLGSIGIVLGMAVALAASRLMGAVLFGVEPADTVSFTAAAALVLSVALAASFVPAWKASRSDPLAALRRL